MTRLIVPALLLAGISAQAGADCLPSSRVTGSALTNLVSGNTVCATSGTKSWQEQHRAGGQLWDYKKGPTDPVDPSKQVGTWSIAANSVTYSYTNGPSYTYSIHGNGPYSFCTGPNGTEVITGAYFKPGNASCP